MIEDKELGIKIAENKHEKLWTEMKQRAESEIRQSYVAIEINQMIMGLADKHLKGELKEPEVKYVG